MADPPGRAGALTSENSRWHTSQVKHSAKRAGYALLWLLAGAVLASGAAHLSRLKVTDPGSNPGRWSARRLAAARRGAENAERDWRRGLRRFFLHGLPAPPSEEEHSFAARAGLDLAWAGGCTLPQAMIRHVVAYNDRVRELARDGDTQTPAAAKADPTPTARTVTPGGMHATDVTPSPVTPAGERRVDLCVAAFAAPSLTPMPWDRHQVTETSVFEVSVDNGPPRRVSTSHGTCFRGLARGQRHLIVFRLRGEVVEAFHLSPPKDLDEDLCLVRTGYGYWALANPRRCGLDEKPSPRPD